MTSGTGTSGPAAARNASTVSPVSSASSMPFSQPGIGSFGSMCTASSSVVSSGPMWPSTMRPAAFIGSTSRSPSAVSQPE